MTKSVFVRDVQIGGGAQIPIQTMTNTLTTDIRATLKQIESTAALGARLVRVSVPDMESACALKEITSKSPVPIIADVHYDYKLALKAIDCGAHKIRINPGNLSKIGLKEVAKVLSERKIPVRVGVNRGSQGKGGLSADELCALCLDSAKLMEDAGVTDMVLAVKSSDVLTTINAYRKLHAMTDYPLHIGLTESGTAEFGKMKSAVAIGALLADGIGDTVRVSLSDEPEKEVIAAKQILRATGLLKDYVEIISCPTCARTEIPVAKIAGELYELTQNIEKPLKIAVMGCTVNGVGESENADFGVCGGAGNSAIFKNGKIFKRVDNERIKEELLALLGEH